MSDRPTKKPPTKKHPTEQRPTKKLKTTHGDDPQPQTKSSSSRPQPTEKVDKHALFTTWSQARGVCIPNNAVAPRQLPGRGIGLVTTAPITKGSRVLFVPEKAMFKIDPHLRTLPDLKDVSPQGLLALSALQARDQLAPWIATWPTMNEMEEAMPWCWSPQMQRLLPSSMREMLNRQIGDLGRDFKLTESICEVKGPKRIDEGSEGDLWYFWLIVNSRSFSWDKDKDKSAEGMVLCPWMDYLNHAPSGVEGATCGVFQREGGYEVVAERDYGPNEELLVSYGSHSNDTLLIHYGFLLPPNADDEIRLDYLFSSSNPRPCSLYPTKNEVCFNTQITAREAMRLDVEKFMLEGEDGREDEVDLYVRQLLRGWSGVCYEKMRASERWALPESVVVAERWQQILTAIDAYLAAHEI